MYRAKREDTLIVAEAGETASPSGFDVAVSANRSRAWGKRARPHFVLVVV